MQPRDLRPCDVVQIDPASSKVFGGCLMVVSKPKSWGAQGYVRIPGKGDAYYRCKFEEMEYVGRAIWAHPEDATAED
jgi:hypothetical protein